MGVAVYVPCAAVIMRTIQYNKRTVIIFGLHFFNFPTSPHCSSLPHQCLSLGLSLPLSLLYITILCLSGGFPANQPLLLRDVSPGRTQMAKESSSLNFNSKSSLCMNFPTISLYTCDSDSAEAIFPKLWESIGRPMRRLLSSPRPILDPSQ